MTTIKQGIKLNGLKKEVKQIRETAEKAAVSKISARRFLLSTGVYSASGRLKPQFR